MVTYKQRLIDLFYELELISYGDFILSSGKKSHYKIEAKPLFLHPEGIKIVRALALETISEYEEKDNCKYELAGVHSGGSMFVELLVEPRKQETVSINYKKKEIFGKIKRSKYIIFEDVITTGGSIINSSKVLRNYGGDPKYVIAIVDREEGGKENLIREGLNLEAFLTKADLKVTPYFGAHS